MALLVSINDFDPERFAIQMPGWFIVPLTAVSSAVPTLLTVIGAAYSIMRGDVEIKKAKDEEAELRKAKIASKASEAKDISGQIRKSAELAEAKPEMVTQNNQNAITQFDDVVDGRRR